MNLRSELKTQPATPMWRDIVHRFSDGRSCLAAFLAMETAEILDGIKPANLINIVNARQSCGRNLYRLWESYGAELIQGSGLASLVLRRRPDALLLFVYHPESLSALLAQRRVANMLGLAGYREPDNLSDTLSELGRRLDRNIFPHEIGIFLGYPLKDVAAFMGWVSIPFSCQGPWKIYGDPRPSLQLAERHRACRCRMAWQVASCDDPEVCLRLAG